MPDTRTVLRVDGTGNVSAESEPCPDPDDGEVLVELHATGVSPGSIASGVARRREDPNPSRERRRLGYQGAGDVLETGAGVDLDAGQRVACFGSGHVFHGTHAVVPRNLCAPLPEGVSYAEGAFGNIAATAVNVVRRGDLRLGEYVAVMGLGPVGQFVAGTAGAAGARVLGVDRLPGRVERAEAAGLERGVRAADADPVAAAESFTDGLGVDCGVVAFGGDASGAVEQLAEMAARRPDGHQTGRIVVVGGATVEADFPVPLGNLDIRAASRTGPGYKDGDYERGADYPEGLVRWDTRRNLAEALRLIAAGEVDVEAFTTHRVPLSEAERGFDALIDDPDGAVGVVVEP